jgi:hypothetical protein
VRTAIRETKRPIPENNAMETKVLLSDFSDDAVDTGEADDAGRAVDTGIGAEMRTAFGMSGSPVQKF